MITVVTSITTLLVVSCFSPAAAKEPVPAKPATMPSAEKKYDSERQKHPNTAEGHLAMALWCEKNGLPDRRLEHLRTAITLDYDCEPALSALGYVRLGDAWVKVGKGTNGKFDQKHPAAPEAAKDPVRLLRDAIAGWYVQVRAIHRAHFVLGGRLASEDSLKAGVEKIRAIQDPLAIPAIAEILACRYDILRQILVDTLGRFAEDEAVMNLTVIALLDPSQSVRHEANLRLIGRKDPRVAAQLREALRSVDDMAVVNAATGLKLLKDREAVPELIKVLRREAPSPEQLNRDAFLAGLLKRFVSPRKVPLGDLQVDYQPAIRVLGADSPIQWNEQRPSGSVYRSEVQEALIEITGVNHGFDKDAWMLWYLQNPK